MIRFSSLLIFILLFVAIPALAQTETPTPSLSPTPGKSRPDASNFRVSDDGLAGIFDLMLIMMPNALRESFADGFEIETGAAFDFNGSPNLGRYWGSGPMLGMGWRCSNELSVDGVIDGSDFYSTNSGLTGGKTRFTDIHLMIMGKYRFFTGDFRPYVLGGGGICLNTELRQSGSAVSDEVDETDWVVEAGAGAELRVNGDFFLYLQSSLVDNLLSPRFAQAGGFVSPVVYVPLTAGIFFGR
jgi:hypothetical protein